MTRPALILDLDGTVVDAVPDFAAAMNRLMVELGLRSVTGPEIAGYLGDGPRKLVERVLAARGLPMIEAAHDRFLADYTAHAAELTTAFPGVAETLDAFRAAGWAVLVCTKKPEAATRAMLAGLGLLDRFDGIGAGDSFAVSKPDPRHLTMTLAAAGLDRAPAVMVGDHANDVAAARGAGLPCIFAGWGHGPARMAAGADLVATRFAELVRMAPQALAARGVSAPMPQVRAGQPTTRS
ncbi:HAD hydrolase-like protein [Tistrella sp. BH-R2-4]|uniref:phosphoglycolate phosphatase n=1 Tax=Tistrella arctica TaxID=3133430 RepID=A0ABU9YPR2_9PROT